MFGPGKYVVSAEFLMFLTIVRDQPRKQSDGMTRYLRAQEPQGVKSARYQPVDRRTASVLRPWRQGFRGLQSMASAH
jgi:hypothetical protein